MERTKSNKPVGTYVPPAKRVKSEKFDVGSEEHQRSKWDENKKKITGLINRANTSNVTDIVKELFKCNLIRYKGLFVSALFKAQEASPLYTNVYAALLAVINSRIRTIGLLAVNRLVLQYKTSFNSDNKPKCVSTVKFIAHLINQEMIDEVLGFEMIDNLLSRPTPSSIEIAINFVKECGAKLEQLDSRHLFEVFRTFRELSLDNDFDSRTHELIDLIHDIRKDKFEAFPPVKRELDLVDEDDRITHSVKLGDPRKEDYHMEFNYFKLDPKWKENEEKYEEFIKSLLESAESSSEDSNDSENESADEIKEEAESKDDKKIIDATGTDLIAFRRTVYLTIRSSVRYEEVVHKLLKARIDPKLHDELCQMIIDCCGQERTYQSIYGLVASKLCQINRREFAPKFERIFGLFYDTIHRFETNKMRNIAKFYAHLLATESIDWGCMSCLKLRENATTSAGRCFIMFLFQDLVAILSMSTLIEYIREPAKEAAFTDLFPRDQEQDIRFAINFFTCSGLGQLTEDLRQELVKRQ